MRASPQHSAMHSLPPWRRAFLREAPQSHSLLRPPRQKSGCVTDARCDENRRWEQVTCGRTTGQQFSENARTAASWFFAVFYLWLKLHLRKWLTPHGWHLPMPHPNFCQQFWCPRTSRSVIPHLKLTTVIYNFRSLDSQDKSLEATNLMEGSVVWLRVWHPSSWVRWRASFAFKDTIWIFPVSILLLMYFLLNK